MKIYNFLIISLLLFLIGASLWAQPTGESRTDSLLAILRANPHDTVKIDTYLLLHTEFLPEDTTQSLKYLHQAINASEKVDDKRRISRSYLELCNYLWHRGRLNDAKQALINVEQQITFVHDPLIKATFYIEQGVVNSILGNYHQAVDDLFKALAGYEALEDTLGIAKCYTNIGNAFLHLKDDNQALHYYHQALNLSRHIRYQKGEANALGNIGRIYRIKGDYDKALDHYYQSLNMNQELDYPEDARIDLHNIGTVYTKLEKLDTALQYFKQAHELAKSIDSKRGILYATHSIAVIEARRGNYETSNKMLAESLDLAIATGMKEEMKNIHLSYFYNYEETGQFKLALKHRKMHEQWKDSLINEKNLNQIKELELKYETAKKNEKIAILVKEKATQRAEIQRQAILKQASLGGLFAVLLLASLLIYTLRQRINNQQLLAAKNEEIKQANFKQQLSELEMKALRAQMNPHFIFNCINSINRMVLSGDGGASRYLTKFAKLIRLMLENSETPTVSLEDELLMLEAYLQLESLRFKEKIRYEIVVDNMIDRETTCLPAMVLQPFIENAIWHGLMPKEGDGLIKITIQEEEEVLKCIIEDNGVGREQALALATGSVVKKKSMGLQITEDRLRLLSTARLKELVRITDLKDSMNRALGTRVDVLIPIS